MVAPRFGVSHVTRLIDGTQTRATRLFQGSFANASGVFGAVLYTGGRPLTRWSTTVAPRPLRLANDLQRASVANIARTIAFPIIALAAVRPSVATAQPITWDLRTVGGPPGRYGPAMVYDSAHAVSVLFGGINFTNPIREYAETWEWNGTAWTRRAVGGPPSRYLHAMCYDAGRGVTVLFGGLSWSTGGFSLRDTWEWNGTSWTQRATTGPSPRHSAGMVYDASRGVTVLFGGQSRTTAPNSVSNAETWEWNGTTWTQRFVGGPSARYAHAMAYDAARGVTVLFGGNPNSPSFSGETWEWNGTAWTQRLVTGPSPRYIHEMAYDASRGVVVLFGGIDDNDVKRDTWEFNGTSWTQRTTFGGPSERRAFAMAFDAAAAQTVVFGGSGDGGPSNGETWTLGPHVPCPADLDNDGDFANGLTRDGAVTIEDLLSFLVGFEAGNVLVDLDNGTSTGTPDNAVDANDLLFFLVRFEAGC